MSGYESTRNRDDVGIMVHNLLEAWCYDTNCEILLYCNEGNWNITVDRQFYSLGLKKDDTDSFLQKTIKAQQDEINQLKAKISAIKTVLR